MTDLSHYQMFIDGAWVDAEDGRSFESLNPSTGEPWAVIPEATAGDVDRAVRAAHRAYSEGPWANMTPTERGRYLRRLADLLAEKSEDLGRVETIDTGKMLKETRWQAKYIAEFFHYYAGCAVRALDRFQDGDDAAVTFGGQVLERPAGRHLVAALDHAAAQLGREFRGCQAGPGQLQGRAKAIQIARHAAGAAGDVKGHALPHQGEPRSRPIDQGQVDVARAGLAVRHHVKRLAP